ncbi:MAG: endonuclease/exonuclease/phosphatase family protein [Flavobacteriales bacterium]
MKRQLKLAFVALAAIMMWSASCKDTTRGAVEGASNEITVAFYNVENIFDVENDPQTNDDDFTPTGKLEWTEDRYRTKLSRIAEVMGKMKSDFPDIIGMCEVENRKVLEDLVALPQLKAAKYKIIHKDSPDERGIDVALLYKSDVISEEEAAFLRVEIPEDPNERTRDILKAKLKIGGESIYFFVNHWPSRSGGEIESEFKRMAAARILKSALEPLEKAGERVIVMGDFNDHPDNKSITEVLQASTNMGSGLYNLAAESHKNGVGSYWYKGEWGALDQFIVTPALLTSTKGWVTSVSDFRFLKDPSILFTDNKGVERPNRTYVGDDYKGGYSDHLPIVLTLRKK